MAHQHPIRNPGLLGIVDQLNPSGYQYYAGYSEQFVEDVLLELSLPATAVVLDPWNGSGTTTQVSEDIGVSSVGLDANPVMVVVAKARCLDPGVHGSLDSLCDDIIFKARRYRCGLRLEPDPLSSWFVGSGILACRKLQRAIHVLLTPSDTQNAPQRADHIDALSDLAAFFYVALFRTVRLLASPFRTSNPTWIRVPPSAERREIAASTVLDMFRYHIGVMGEALSARRCTIGPKAILRMADSAAIPMDSSTVSAVISSPPYCTRIDYAVATRPELAVLGFDPQTGLKELRRRLIGSPTIMQGDLALQPAWGQRCMDLLESVSEHPAKSSRSYYYRQYLQYFDSIFRSLQEINRVLTHGGRCVLVVQDSYFKGIHVDLPLMFEDMSHSLGWTLSRRQDFTKRRTMAGMNPKIRKYRDTCSATESALFFLKG